MDLQQGLAAGEWSGRDSHSSVSRTFNHCAVLPLDVGKKGKDEPRRRNGALAELGGGGEADLDLSAGNPSFLFLLTDGGARGLYQPLRACYVAQAGLGFSLLE